MHDAALVKALIAQVARIEAEQGGCRVRSVSVRLGALSGLSAGHLQETFATLKAGTALEHAGLQVEVVSEVDDPGIQDLRLESVEVAD